MTGPPHPPHPLDGILIADKGGGVTSFQVVAHLRRVLRVPKVGHGGTLDPMATGVLPILLGEATKLTAYLQAHDKEYEAIVRLGRETDTLDATGRVTAERPVPPLTLDRLRAALTAFEGEIEQVPPMFSALHVGGRRLHELARAGVEVARPPRRVRIDRIEMLDWTPPRLAIRVACGSGTYIRTLAADLGGALGCGGSLDALRRTRLGPFALTTAVDWDLLRSGTAEQLAAHVEPPDHAVLHLPAVRLDEASAQRLRHGQHVLPEHREPVPAVVGRCRLYAAELFLGIGEVDADGIRALRLLHARNPRARPVSP
jgi:tRNA pseudouridine55 synthase